MPAAFGAAGAALAAGVALLVWQQSRNAAADTPAVTEPMHAAGFSLPRQNAVLVFGASGKLGRQVVQQLVRSGRTVVAAVRDADRARAAFAELGLQEGAAGQPEQGALIIEGGVDITEAPTLGTALWRGVTQTAIAVGPVFGKLPGGGMGYLDGMTSERVDAGGVANIAEAVKAALADEAAERTEEVLPMRSAEDLAAWGRLDDVIMGGRSSSGLAPAEDGAVWSGDLITEGGGFCGTRTQGALDLDLGGYDGLALRVCGDGQTFKVNLKTADQANTPEETYQASFDTRPGEWVSVQLPWHAFVPVNRARVDPNAPPLDPSNVRQLGLVLSRFEYNGFPNVNHHPGPFELQIRGGIGAYRAARPRIVLVSSGGVERNAVIGDDAEARKADIPIVQLNPGGTLNYKYMGEAAVRGAGVPYTVIRSTGLTSEDAGVPFLLEASQGDRISGKIARAEVATLLAAALCSPAAAGKTVEVRRCEAADARGRTPSPADLERLFTCAVEDRLRPYRRLPPMPGVVPPPPPPGKERTAEILADERVQAAAAAGRGGRVREPQEAAAARSVVVTSSGTQAEQEGSAPASSNGASGGGGERAQEARSWVNAWRARSPERALPKDEPVGSAAR
ncbi:hypothetical protein WJX81_005527 [Elliptochloris bilobata]|uniref:NADH:ubiquinone oxidoreductase intermediate-associated protein 30 domain-containing protein n=1 Tax=Elliptochloris bilobata TaxID=381761 RepID=A0AAW1QGQ6_9CHLO